jgi:hypothetical protein
MPARERRIEISEDLLLLVEGRDEFHLFEQLIESCFSYTPGIQVMDIGGKTTLGRNLKTVYAAALSRPSLRAIGVVRDADASAAASFQSVRDSVQQAGYTPPPTHAEFSDASPSIGIFIAPDGSAPGAIETICRRSVQEEEAARCADAYIDCLETHNALKSDLPDKAFTHAYLAATSDPVARVGEGALQGVWNFQSPAFANLREFVYNLASR